VPECRVAAWSLLFAALASACSGATAEKLIAAVLEHEDERTEVVGALDLATRAGFDARPLEPANLVFDETLAVLIFGSFSDQEGRYNRLLARRKQELFDWVKAGGVVVQFSQGEAEVSCIPDEFTVKRENPDHQHLYVLDPGHPLLRDWETLERDGITRFDLPPHFNRPESWNTFTQQAGFHVILAADRAAQFPVMLELAYGKGRIVLTSMFFDKLAKRGQRSTAPPKVRATAETFFQNLNAYVTAVRAGTAPPAEPTPAWKAAPPAEFTPGAWTLVVLPDTQNYAEKHPDVFEAQTRWIAENKERLNLRFVVQEGDITNNNKPAEWEVARKAFGLIDGVVPFALTTGNHDCGDGGRAKTRDTLINEYFPVADAQRRPGFGGVFEAGRIENAWYTFDAGGAKWLVLALEWAPRDAVVAWADEVLRGHADHAVIAVTHAYLYNDDSRYDRTCGREQSWHPDGYGTAKDPAGANDGEDLWKKLFSRHANVRFVLSGHVLGDGTGRLTSTGEHGNRVHEILANYQMRRRGGEGYLRLMEFQPDGKTVRIKSYSPLLNAYLPDTDQQFEVELSPAMPAWK